MISVIIPLYNKETIIECSLRSVLAQDYDDFEVVIVDDGSTDNSLKKVEQYLEQYKPLEPLKPLELLNPSIPQTLQTSHSLKPVNIVRQPNGGPSKARNTGVKHAKGEWIVFLDADDELLPGALKHYSALIEVNKDCNFIASPFYNYNGKEKRLHFPYKEEKIQNPYKAHFFGKFLPRTGAFVCKRDLLIKHPFNEGIRRFEDLDMLFRLYHDTIIFTDSRPSMVVNSEFAEASHGRKDIKEDFVGHIDFKRKSFWEKMCLYQLFMGERPHYPEQCKKLYPSLYKRWDLYFIYQLLSRTKRIWT